MSELLKDSRFGNVPKDPKFRNMPKSKRKIKIDKRFLPMLKNKEFRVVYTSDKRGRPVNQSSAEDFKKFYNYSSEDDADDDDEDTKSQDDDDDSKCESDDEQVETDDAGKNKKLLKKNKLQQSDKLENTNDDEDSEGQDDDDDPECESDDEQTEINDSGKNKKLLKKNKSQQSNKLENEGKKNAKKKTKTKNESDSNESDSDNDVDDDDKEENKDTKSKISQKLKDLSIDYARGNCNLFSSSSSEEEDSEEEEEEQIEHCWAELDKDAEEIDEPTTRLALCHMNWDRIRAVDIMVLFTSFLPPGGSIKSVTIYPTEFGIERMKEEELKGPIEITESKKIEDDLNNDGDTDSEEQKEKVREYQLNRLKYYVAVIVFDSKESAETIYKALDGFEYESSATRMDLRVITDDRVFDQEPKEVCNKYPDVSRYKPRTFITTALQQVKCESTWDETDIERQEIADKINKGQIDEISHDDIGKYVATSSSEEESGNENNDNNLDEIQEPDNNENKNKKKSRIDTFRLLLLQQAEENEKKKKKTNIDLECTWGLDIKEKTEKLVKEKINQKEKEGLSSIDKLLLKRKEKKKAKLEKIKKLKNKSGNASDSEDSIPSDIDMNDPYFKDEMINMKPNKAKNKKSKKNAVDSDDEKTKQDNAELELLLLDKEDEKLKNHFDMNKIEKNETLSKSKKKRLSKKNKAENKNDFEDNFEINVKDPRFDAVYSCSDFNIDPTDPHYRNTKGNELIRKEKFKRRGDNNNSNNTPAEEPLAKRSKNTGKTLDVDVDALVRRVKSNTKNISKKIK